MGKKQLNTILIYFGRLAHSQSCRIIPHYGDVYVKNTVFLSPKLIAVFINLYLQPKWPSKKLSIQNRHQYPLKIERRHYPNRLVVKLRIDPIGFQQTFSFANCWQEPWHIYRSVISMRVQPATGIALHS